MKEVFWAISIVFGVLVSCIAAVVILPIAAVLLAAGLLLSAKFYL